MDAIDVLMNISNTNLIKDNSLRYCLVSKDKIPYTINGKNAKPNSIEDFVSLDELLEAKNIENYAGIGISIKASNICAIDIDHCFLKPFDFESGDERAKYAYENFKDLAYIEFSFSGTGMRILFRQENIENYNDTYYVKNSVNQIEYYQPSGSARYVTVTGKAISNNTIDTKFDFKQVIIDFLNKYMVRPKKSLKTEIKTEHSGKDIGQLMKVVKYQLFKNNYFQMLWFDRKEWLCTHYYEGTGESEHDMALISYIYTNITQDKLLVRQIFEESDYFKTKDKKHKDKWYYQDYRYYNFVFDRVK